MLWAEAAGAGAQEGGVGEALTHEVGNTLQIPAGVDGAEAAEVEEEGKAFHPCQPFGPFVHVLRELRETHPQTAVSVQPAGTQPVAPPIGLVVEDGVVFMVAHDGEGVAAFDHGADEVEDLPDLGAAVDVVAKENDAATLGVMKTQPVRVVTEVEKQVEEFIVVAVDIADKVKRDGMNRFHDDSLSLTEPSLLVFEMQYNLL